MGEPSRAFKWGSVIWALLIGGGLVVIAGSILLPSTKRARIDLDQLRQDREEAEARLATRPADEPTTTPAELKAAP